MRSKHPRRTPRHPETTGCERGERAHQLVPEEAAIIERQRLQFIEQFGREPGPADPIFFDPSSDEPRPLDHHQVEDALVDAARKAGLDPVRVMQSVNMRDCEIEAALRRAVRRRRG